MFDVGFSEMLLIGIVALVVIGPERLPKVARTIGHLMGRAQRYVNDVKRDIDREMQIEELRKLQTEMQDAARNIEASVTSQVGEVKSELDKAQDTMNEFARQAELAAEAGSVQVAEAGPARAEAPSSDLTRLDDPLSVELAEPPPHIEPDYAEGAMISANAASVTASAAGPVVGSAATAVNPPSTPSGPAASPQPAAAPSAGTTTAASTPSGSAGTPV